MRLGWGIKFSELICKIILIIYGLLLKLRELIARCQSQFIIMQETTSAQESEEAISLEDKWDAYQV